MNTPAFQYMQPRTCNHCNGGIITATAGIHKSNIVGGHPVEGEGDCGVGGGEWLTEGSGGGADGEAVVGYWSS